MIRTPLFWDLHLHGAVGVDFMHATTDSVVHACEALGKNGIGFFAPTLLTAEPARLAHACERWGHILERVSEKGYLPRNAARPIGLHLEGPFLNPQMAGAHPKTALRRPSLKVISELIKMARGHVSIVTMAPELKDALPVIRALSKRGVRVQLGHTMATASEALAAVKAGATGITHLHNAMRVHHRAPGVLTPLRQGLLTAEIITDGIHLDPEFTLWSLKAANGHAYAVSDGCCAIGAPKSAPLTLGDLKLKRENGAAYVVTSNTLAGGATYLTEHPSRVFTRLANAERAKAFSIFHATQSKIFKSHAMRGPRGQNHFDPRSLKFLGRT